MRFVGYARVSTRRQGDSGLGIDAQREAIAQLVASRGGELVASFVEVESGKRDDRPEMKKALNACRAFGAVLVVAKLDRLARSARFLLELVEGTGESGVIFCDLPQVPAGAVGKFLISQMASVAELERGLIAERTRAALKAAKARGVKLGNPKLKPGCPEGAALAREALTHKAIERSGAVVPLIAEIKAAGVQSLDGIAQAMNARGIKTARGKRWHASTVRNLLARGQPA